MNLALGVTALFLMGLAGHTLESRLEGAELTLLSIQHESPKNLTWEA